MAATQQKWHLSGDYFENCNCNIVCPCLVSPSAPLTTRPSQGVCDVALIFHIEKGNYGKVSLDGLNVAVVGHAPGPMERATGRLPPISMSALMNNRRRRSVPFSAAPRVAPWRPSRLWSASISA